MLEVLRRRVARLFLVGSAITCASAAWAQSLPASVQSALARANIPREAVSMYVAPVEASQPARLVWQASTAMNPASVMKLVTTYAALEQLGPTYVWRTPVYLDGVIDSGAFRGTVYIKGSGDPKLVSERLWLLLGRLQGMGVKVIVGDIVVDRTAFQVNGHDPAAFDGEPFRPYNAGPDALLINYKTQVLGFIPDVSAGIA
ncbi:MAG: D-alanyl-D-alanine carboxypeptidase, partial [Comamonas sp.]|nr:D-alanyl-D-alanine carboxypeptidase [Candidatus Comamonas equi]